MSINRWGNARTDVPHWVYTYYNDNESAPERRVLYVGFTNDMQDRDAAHRRSGNDWRAHATRLVLVEYPDRDTASAAERRAIAKHVPLGNLNTNPRRRQVHRSYLSEQNAERVKAFEKYWTELHEQMRHLRAS